jgi:alkanesulfonate monooxygenase SsuD/methylene tetrahydromethanopterin reductase-like flavin-dependent oxidoreductase (luciferase family)
MQIDIALEPEFTADQVAELGALAERNGITTFWITNDSEARDVFLLFARLAQATSKIRLGIMAISPWEMHPLKLANALLTLDEISNGRAAIIIGGGGAILQHVPFDLTRRVRTVAECIEILKSVGPEKPLNFAGEIFQIRNYRPAWAAPKRLQVLAGANKDQMLRMSAKQSDGVVMSDVPLQIVGDCIETVRRSLEIEGREDTGFEFNNFWAFHVKRDKLEAVTEARSRLVLRGMLERLWIDPFLNDDEVAQVRANMPSFYRAFRERHGTIDKVPESIIDSLLENLTLTASVEELDSRLEVLHRFAETGLTHLTLGLHEDPAEAIELIGERVMPALGLHPK